jgi:hypothetical protein
MVRTPAKPKKKFSADQDEKIRELVGDQRFPDWKTIAEQIEGKNARQCRERYQHYLAPDVCPEPWTPDEDAHLSTLYAQFPNDWARIAERMSGRTNTGVKNRFHSAGFRQNCAVNTGERDSPTDPSFDIDDFEIPTFGDIWPGDSF